MSKLPPPNFHVEEQPTAMQVGVATRSIFDRIYTDLKENASSNFANLSGALNNVMIVLTKIMSDIGTKKKKMAKNKEGVYYSVVKIPDPNVPKIADANQTVNYVVGGYTSAEIEHLHRAMSLGQTVRVPKAVTDFEAKKIDLVVAKLAKQYSDIKFARNNVEAIKAIVDSKQQS